MTTPELQTDAWVPALTFAARLALIRHHQGWNIKEAAVACGISPQSWRGWELEGRLPHDQLTVVAQIAERTAVDLTWLRDGGELAPEPKRRHLRAVGSTARRRTNEGSTRRAGRRHAAIKATTCAPPTVRGDADQPGTRRPQRVFAHRTDTAA